MKTTDIPFIMLDDGFAQKVRPRPKMMGDAYCAYATYRHVLDFLGKALDDKDCAVPFYRQIYEAVRRSILSGEFNRGMQLAATRQLAKKLGVSRM